MVTGRGEWMNIHPLRLSTSHTLTLHPTIHSDSVGDDETIISMKYRGGKKARNTNVVFPDEILNLRVM